MDSRSQGQPLKGKCYRVSGQVTSRVHFPTVFPLDLPGLLLNLPLLWFAPVALFSGLPLLQFVMGALCIWFLWKMIYLAYHDLAHRYGMVLALWGTALILWFPPLLIVWYFLLPARDQGSVRQEKALRTDVLPAWEEHKQGNWKARVGYERAQDSLHVERDLLAGKSRAAIQAHLEREMKELPQVTDFIRDLSDRQEAEADDKLAGFFPSPQIAATVDDLEDRMYVPPEPPAFQPPHIAGVSDYTLDRLYSQGKFDEIVALLRTRLMMIRDRGGKDQGLEDYLRLARSQQLHRELEKYRAEYDKLALMDAPGTDAPGSVTAPAPPRAASPDSSATA